MENLEKNNTQNIQDERLLRDAAAEQDVGNDVLEFVQTQSQTSSSGKSIGTAKMAIGQARTEAPGV